MISGSLPVVAIAGRPNVGKSTLFNRLVGRRVAIVDDRPGVTRDSIIVKAKLGGRACYLVDTGGLTGDKRKRGIDADVEKQILRSIAGADVIILVADCSGGIVQDDVFVSDVIRRSGRQVVLVANKADSAERVQRMSTDLFELGFGEPLPVSALLGSNLAALGERVAKFLPEAGPEDMGKRVNFCIVGRPNVGKSSIVNAVLGQDRCVVSSVPGTTRDSIAADFSWGGTHFTIVDTAGQRRRKSNLDDVEFYSITRARESIRASNVAVLVIDAADGLLEGDKRIAAAVLEARRGFLIVVNKMDLVDAELTELFVKHLASEAPFLRNTPVVFVSALMREGMDIVLDNIADVHERMNTPLPNELLENVIYDVRALFSPKVKGRSATGAIHAVLHDRVDPPRVIIKVDDKTVFTTDYIRMIENRLREVFNLSGVPIDIIVADGPVHDLKAPEHGPAQIKPGRAKPERRPQPAAKASSKPAKKKFTLEKPAPKSKPKSGGKSGPKGATKFGGRTSAPGGAKRRGGRK